MKNNQLLKSRMTMEPTKSGLSELQNILINWSIGVTITIDKNRTTLYTGNYVKDFNLTSTDQNALLRFYEQRCTNTCQHNLMYYEKHVKPDGRIQILKIKQVEVV
jgi:hypothetical protein